MRASTKEEEHEYSITTTTAPLLSPGMNGYSSHRKPAMATRFIFISLVFSTCIALSAACAFAFLLFSSSKPGLESARPLKKLQHPVVLLISSDGFRFGYQFKTDTPNIHRLIKNGTEAENGLISVFPTATFPNHHSIVTGLYPSWHGIIYNNFTDPETGEFFGRLGKNNNDPKWWLGEPLWETVVKSGLKASAYFWPGSEVNRTHWTCPSRYCKKYVRHEGFDVRVDTTLEYFDLTSDEIPSFMALYFESPDSQGHKVGPDDTRITRAVAELDKMIGKLIHGLEERKILDDVNIILVGDHGMVGTCGAKLIFLSDLEKWIKIPEEWVIFDGPILGIRPSTISAKDVVDKMREGLKTITNGKYLDVSLKEELPNRMHYSTNDRIPPIIGLVDEGFKVVQTRSQIQECGGAHGYDNQIFSMRSIFIGHGPQFARGKKVPSFENIEIYNLVTSILNIKDGAPNNGSASFPKTLLLPSH